MCALISLLSRVQQRGAHHGDGPSRHALTRLAKTDVVQAGRLELTKESVIEMRRPARAGQETYVP